MLKDNRFHTDENAESQDDMGSQDTDHAGDIMRIESIPPESMINAKK